MRLISALSLAVSDWLDAERGRLAVWLAVFMGAGVATYYALRFEPPVWIGPAAVALAVPSAVLVRRMRWLLAPLAAVALGFASGQLATARAPPLESALPTHATVITGPVEAVETLPEGRRIVIHPAFLDGAGEPLARSVRVRLRNTDDAALASGDTVRIRALIRPPAPPAYPGAWDLQRDAFYAGLGASGYALGPAERVAAAVPSAPMRRVQWLREAIARRVTAIVPGAAGAVCVTLLTGSSMAIPAADHAAFRDSGLAHLLAVAGLHIGVVMGFALLLSRRLFALSEHASLFWPTKKLAVLVALSAGAAYMVLTGMHVPIIRSFVMACLLTVAILTGRNPVSLRGLALAAAVLMLIAPEALPDVSFQMSFSAVLALIAGYEALRPWLRRLHGSRWRRFQGHLAALALTSALAGSASAPFGAYHFGQVQVYFILANMIAVPLTALFVMPAGLIALVLMPLHLEPVALVPMGWGAQGVIWVAHTTSSLPAARFDVPHSPLWGLCVFSLGLAWLGIWRTPVRLAGVAAMLLGLASPLVDHPPDLLMSADARLIAVRTADGMLLQQSQGGSKFTRDAWMQYWAIAAVTPIPASGDAGAAHCGDGFCIVRPYPDRKGVLLARGATRPDGCDQVSVIVSAEPARGLCPKPWPKLADRFTVWREGSVAIWLRPAGATILTDRAARGDRPWVPPPPKPRQAAPVTLPPAAIDNG
jgi:competence protein ComEC